MAGGEWSSLKEEQRRKPMVRWQSQQSWKDSDTVWSELQTKWKHNNEGFFGPIRLPVHSVTVLHTTGTIKVDFSAQSVLKATRIHSWCLKTRQSPFWKMLIPSSHAQISHCRFKILSYSISRKQDTDLVCKRCTSWVYQFLSCAQRQKHRKPDMEGMDNMHYIL